MPNLPSLCSELRGNRGGSTAARNGKMVKESR